MTVQSIPAGYHSVTPYINIKGALEAIEFYKKAFSAKEIMRLTMSDGSIAHAEIEIGDSKIMLAETKPQWDNKSPQDLRTSAARRCVSAYTSRMWTLYLPKPLPPVQQ